MTNLDVKTAFDEAKPQLCRRSSLSLSLTGVHGNVVAT